MTTTSVPAENHARMEWALDRLGECDIDLTPAVYEKFFARHSSVRPMFHDRSRETQGRMLYEVISMLVDAAAQREWVDGMVTTTVCDHGNYGPIGVDDYRMFLETIEQCLRDALDSTGAASADVASCLDAWHAQTERLLALIKKKLAERFRPATADLA